MSFEFSTDDNLNASYREIKDSFIERLMAGDKTVCPMCERKASFYDRSIHKTMALGLASLYVLHKTNPNERAFHIKEISNALGFFHNASDVGKCSAWGLVTPDVKTEKDQHKRCPGRWILTSEGFEFVENKKAIKRIAVMYEGNVVHYCGELVNFSDCLKESFDINRVYEMASLGVENDNDRFANH